MIIINKERVMKPNLENLESRLVPATLTWNLNSQSKDGLLQIDLPKDSGNVLAVSGAGVKIKVENYKNDSVRDLTTGVPGTVYNSKLNVPDLNVNSYLLDGEQVKSIPDVNWIVNIKVNGSDKNDYIDIVGFIGFSSTVFGFGGDDSIFGSGYINSIDNIFGGNGNDFITGGWGNDSIFGENGNDKLDGGKGSDRLSGLGSDYLSDPDAASFSSGGGGIDTIVTNNKETYVYNDNYIPNDKNPADRIGMIKVYKDISKETFTYVGKFFNGNKNNEKFGVTRTFIGKNRLPASETYVVPISAVPTWYG